MTELVLNDGFRLDWVKLQLTRLCNFKCQFCSQSDWASKETIDLDAFHRAVISRVPKLRLLIVTGGEPLARFIEMARVAGMASENGAQVGVFSNLSLLSIDKGNTLRHAGVHWFRTTLNGHTTQTHEKTYPAGSFEKTMRGIKVAQECGFSVKIRSTVCQANVNFLPELVEFVHSMGISELDFRPYLPLGDCNPHNSHALSSPQHLAAAAQILHLKKVLVGRITLKLLPNWFDFLYRDLIGDNVSTCEKCHCGRQYIYVDSVGNYRACAGHRAIIGSIFDTPIDAIWGSSGWLHQARTYDQDPYCSSCPRRVECHGSNCHLINYEVHGRFDKVNPTCPIYVADPASPVAGFAAVREQFQKSWNGIPTQSIPA